MPAKAKPTRSRRNQAHPIPSHLPERMAAAVVLLIFLAIICALMGCIMVDKSVHVYAQPGSTVHTTTTNISTTEADGNTLDAEGGIKLP